MNDLASIDKRFRYRNFPAMLKLGVLLTFTTILAFGQENVAIIKGNDGYTTIQEGGSATSKVVGQVKKGEFFLFFPSEEEWWEVFQDFNVNGDPVNLRGYMHKSKILPISSLPDIELRRLILEIMDKELHNIKTSNEAEKKKHHEPKFTMILDAAIGYISKKKDVELLNRLIQTVKLDDDAPDEAPSVALGFIFMKFPDWTLEQIKKNGINDNLRHRFINGFENAAYNAKDYEALKAKIKAVLN